MTQSELDDLCGKHEVTPEMLKKLVNDQWYFEQLFDGNTPPNMKGPLRDWMNRAEEPKPQKGETNA
jgi:hypothetical protein